MEVNELMIMAEAQIDYTSLPEDTLKELGLGNELFVATSALGELASRNSSLAANVAWEILSNSRGDRYLQATALETLFQSNRELALDYMSNQVQECDHYILNTIMELMIENQSDFQPDMASSVSRLICERIKKLNNEQEFIDLGVINSFLNVYGEVENFQMVNCAIRQSK